MVPACVSVVELTTPLTYTLTVDPERTIAICVHVLTGVETAYVFDPDPYRLLVTPPPFEIYQTYLLVVSVPRQNIA